MMAGLVPAISRNDATLTKQEKSHRSPPERLGELG